MIERIFPTVALVLAAACGPQFAAAQPAAGASRTAASQRFILGPPKGEGPVVVRADFQLHNINGINDEAETFEFTGVLTLKWHDPRQAFDPAAEGVDEKVFQGGYQFDEISPGWFPQVILVNEAGMFEKRGTVLRVQPDGTLTLIEMVNAVARADFGMRRFPFDHQRLEAIFEVLGFDSSEVVLQAKSATTIPSGDSVRVPQWSLAGIGMSTRERSASYAGRRGVASSFVVSGDVHRKSFFIVRLVMWPLAVIVLLSFSVFWMDRSSLGDRISVSFIGILTAVAYQLMTSEILPHISYFTLMHAFLNFSFLTMCATVVINLVVGAYDKWGRPEIGDRIDRRCRRIFPLVYFGLLSFVFVVAFVFN